jgi:aldehyde:ferredoxin oxidoreductase
MKMQMLIVDMTRQETTWKDAPEDYSSLGGRGLTSRMIVDLIPPTCDPLGTKNQLILAPGLLSGTILPNTSRLSIGAKSPLTGGIKESNVGGRMADILAKHRIKAISITGKPPSNKMYLLHIDADRKVRLVTADIYSGMKTYALVRALKEAYGETCDVLCIGPAGEMQLKSASIQTTDTQGNPCRAAGRGGLGAVMGAKGIKAIVVSEAKLKPLQVPEQDAFRKAVGDFSRAVKEAPFSGKTLPALGTASLVGPVNSLGGFPCFNARRGYFENWENISGEHLAETIQQRGGMLKHAGCSGCIIRCSNVFVDEAGAYVTSALEYETIWATGGMCGIDDLDVIAKLDFMCDDIGVDTMNTGTAIAVAMDAGYCPFGDGEAALNLMQEIDDGTPMGRLIGNGPVDVGKHFEHPRVPVCKNQSIAAYDPRALQGMAVTYSTSPMGADHTAGNLIGESLAGLVNPLEKEGQIEASKNKQITVAGIDSLGLCLFTGAAARDEILAALVSAKTGRNVAPAELRRDWKALIEMEIQFNRDAGLTRETDRVASFFYEEPLPPHNRTVLFSDEEIDSTFA